MDYVIWPLLLSFLAGISTVLGSLVIILFKDFRKSYMSFFLGLSAGAMIYLSFMELLPYSIRLIGYLPGNLSFFSGILFIGIIDRIVPHHYLNYCSKNSVVYDKLLFSGYMVAVGIMIHNFPEGIAVFMSSLGNLRYGILIALATALHNIPEGVAVATPIYYATKSRIKAFYYSFLAGIAEPVGAIAAYIILRQFINEVFVAYVFAFVAGIMVYISMDELLPTCFENSQGHRAILGIVIGMLIVSASLFLI
jgi:ZIP family zinc transporter